MGAGLKSSMARMSESANRERCPPLSSVRDCFQTPPNATHTSNPAECSILINLDYCHILVILGCFVLKGSIQENAPWQPARFGMNFTRAFAV